MFISIDFNGQTKIFKNPIKLFICDDINQIKPAIDKITQFINKGYYAAGYLAYESASAFETYHVTKNPSNNQAPLLLIGIFDKYEQPNNAKLNYQHNKITLKNNTSQTQYQQAIKQIKNHIEQGNTYQTNYTNSFDGKFEADPWQYYQFLKQQHQANYCAYIEHQGIYHLSISPELFFDINDNIITTKPMKGTAPRGINLDEDKAQLETLFSEKNQAENMMIVDLLRNDLTKISNSGTVKVTQLFSAEKYPTVWQLTSTIQSELKSNITLFDVLKALFPCGSVTGAPKASTMKIISEIEQSAREVYCGAIGMISPYMKQATFNVPIRTITISEHKLKYHAGGGITWDSTSHGEYQELLDKTAIINSEIITPEYIIESILLTDGEYFLLDLHLQRLIASAHYFDFYFDINQIQKTLNTLANSHHNGEFKVRLHLYKSGKYKFEIDSLSEMIINNISLHLLNVNSDYPLIYHKTSFRNHLPKLDSNSEALLVNENQQITEFVNGNVAVLIDGKWLTPNLHSGLLAGTMRTYYLNNHLLTEQNINIKDLLKADKIAFINSVRKWIDIDKSSFEKLKENIKIFLK